MKKSTPVFAVLLLAALAALCPRAHAQADVRSTSIQLADTSFVKGRALFEQGRLREAAREFEISWRLDPSPGTLLNLAACHEGLGELAQALSTYERAAAAARLATDRRRRRLWYEAAQQRVDDLRQRVPALVLRGIGPSSLVTLDGDAIDGRAPSTAGDAGDWVVRVNPGRHVLRVSAPAKRTLTRELTLTEGARSTLALPPLEPSVEPPSAPRPERALSERAGTRAPPRSAAARSAGPWPLVLGGTGAALLLSSAVTGWLATSKSDELRRACPGDACPESKSLEATRDSGRQLARATDVLWVTGALCAGAGVTLFVLGAGDDADAPSAPSAPAAALRAGCFGSHCGLAASGRF